ncbi:hypothetical protein BGX29_010504 [Mortierella sp. GBA35]|nr:hypothetical protein BGX29_010504 [Mortierella sp. GBA35]
MEQPASTKVLDIPELVSMVTYHLRQADISSLLRSSRQMHTQCISALYRKLDSYYEYKRGMLQSIMATLALGRNIQHVRSAELRAIELAYVYNCYLEFQETHYRVAGLIPPRPRWLPPSDPRTCQVVPLPPMTNLTSLKLYLATSGIDEERAKRCRYTLPSYRTSRATLPQACWIIQQSPHLSHLTLISIAVSDPGCIRLLADTINGLEKLIELVRRLTTYLYPDVTDTELIFRVMETLPEQQVEALSVSNSDFSMDEMTARMIFRRHSATLAIRSKAVQTILVECGALEKFQVRFFENHGGLFIHLVDAVEKPWACTKVHRFDLTIGVTEIELEQDQEPYYFRESPTTLTAEEEQQFALLEKLYRQIGKLTEVRRLDLRLEWLDDQGVPHEDSAYDTNTFPAMLSLGDARTGRRGYLHLLAGLKRLQKLRGSVYMDLDETIETVAWIDENWAELTIAEFFHNRGEDARDCFQWLKKQRDHDVIPLTLGYPHLN